MRYTLFNKNTNLPLKLKIGIWSTDNKQEAEEMLDACLEYVDAIGASYLKDQIIIIDTDCLN